MNLVFGLMLVLVLFTPVLNACAKANCRGMAVNSVCSELNTLTELYMYACPTGQQCDWSTFSISTPGYCKPWGTLSGKNPKVEFDECKSDSECASGKCESNACVGKTLNVECSKTEECGANFYCDLTKSSCQTRKIAGATCEKDFECGNDHGCLFFKCTKLFSFKVGTKVADPSTPNFQPIYLFYCETQFASSSTGKCEHVSPVSTTCVYTFGTKNPCEYVSVDTKEKISAEGLCTCSYDSNEAEVCALGTDTPEKRALMETQLALLARPCHYYNRAECSLIPTEERRQNEKNKMIYRGMDINRHPCFANVDFTTNSCFIQTFFSLLALMITFLLL